MTSSFLALAAAVPRPGGSKLAQSNHRSIQVGQL